MNEELDRTRRLLLRKIWGFEAYILLLQAFPHALATVCEFLLCFFALFLFPAWSILPNHSTSFYLPLFFLQTHSPPWDHLYSTQSPPSSTFLDYLALVTCSLEWLALRPPTDSSQLLHQTVSSLMPTPGKAIQRAQPMHDIWIKGEIMTTVF
jgi:hypothetical protein